jgi:hypothetical protein
MTRSEVTEIVGVVAVVIGLIFRSAEQLHYYSVEGMVEA